MTDQVTAADLLTHMLDNVLTDESKWCQGRLGEDAEGEWTHPTNPNIVRMCLVGGLRKSMHDLGVSLASTDEGVWFTALKALERSASAEMIAGLPIFNDAPTTTFEDVRLVIKRARELVES